MTVQLCNISLEGEPGSLKDWYIKSQHICQKYSFWHLNPDSHFQKANEKEQIKDPKLNEILLFSRILVVIFKCSFYKDADKVYIKKDFRFVSAFL